MRTGTLSQRWHDRPTPADLDPDAVFDAVLALTPTPTPGVDLDIIHDHPDPLIEAREDDRTTQIRLTELVKRLNRNGTGDTPDAITDAVRDWIDTRPVSDRAAAERGIATVVRFGSQPCWQVAVPRPSGRLSAWVPALTSTPETTRTIRDAALDRARALTFTPLQSGRVTVWSYLPEPRLSPSVLAQPETLAAVADPDATIVLTTERPVAIADPQAAARLVAEVNQNHLTFPLDSLTDLGWV